MKRFISILLVFALCFTLVSCSDESPEENKSPLNIEPASDIDVDSLPGEITFPVIFVEGILSYDPDEYAERMGFDEVIRNDDGSVTMTMTKEKQKELIEKTRELNRETLSAWISGEGTPYEDAPYIEQINSTGDFKTIEVLVDRDSYDDASSKIAAESISLSAMLYQIFAGDELYCEVTVKYSDNDEIISTATYPEDWELLSWDNSTKSGEQPEKTGASEIPKDTVIYDKDGIKITYTGLTYDSKYNLAKHGIGLKIENNTSKKYTVQIRDLSVNNIMADDIFSCDVAAGKVAIDSIGIEDSSIEVTGVPTNELSFEFFFREDNSNYSYSDRISIIK